MSQDVAVEQPKNELVVIADKIRTGLQAFENRKTELTTLKGEVEHLKIESLEDKAAIKQVTEARKKLKSVRVEIEKEGKAMRDPLTAISKTISAREKELVDIIEPTEKVLSGQEKWVKDEEARVAREAEEKEKARIQTRINRMSSYGYEIDYNMLISLNDSDFERIVDNARVEYEKEQAAAAEKTRAEQAQREQDEKDRAELKALREKQEAADKILKEREEEIARKEGELERGRIADRRGRVNNRLGRLNNITFDGQEVKWKHDGSILLSGLDAILDPSEEEYTAFVIDHNDKNEKALHEVYLAEEKKREDEEEKRAQQLEEARKDAAAKALSDQKEREAEQRRQESEILSQASDKEKFDVILSYLGNVPQPAMKSVKHKKLLTEVNDLTAKIVAHIQAKA